MQSVLRRADEFVLVPGEGLDLLRVANAGDGPSRFLLKHMDQLVSPPTGWDGHVVLASKRAN